MMVPLQKRSNRITPAMEDYLKAIYVLQQHVDEVSVSSIGEQLGGIKPGSVTGMLKRLSEMNLITYERYRKVSLTESGKKVALEVVRHHRLLELYLVESLGYSWDEVHEEAEELEHYISPKFAARIAASLGQPAFDPHGDPIPTAEGTLPTSTHISLADLVVGTEVRVVRVCDQEAERLRYLAELGLIPGALVQVVARAPFDGPISVQVDDTVQTLDRRLAQTILVEQ